MKKYTYLFAMAFIFALSFICISGVQADTHTWTGSGADNQAATVANWNSMPATGDNVTIGYDARNINWNLPITITLANVWYNGSAVATSNMMITESVNTVITGILAIRSDHATYTIGWSTSVNKLTTGPIILGERGTLSQTGTGGDVTCKSYTQNGAGSVLTGKVDAWFTCGGNYLFFAGSVGWNTIKLKMTTDNSVLVFEGGAIIRELNVQGNVSVNTQNGDPLLFNNGALKVSSNKTLTNIIPNGIILTNVDGLHIEGSIVGTAPLIWEATDPGLSLSVNGIFCPVTIRLHVSSASSLTFKLSEKGICGNLSVTSNHATRIGTLDMNGNRLYVSGLITASTRGIIMSSVPGASIFGPVSTINGGIIDWTNISWNPLPPVINALTITKISGDNGIDEMMHYLAKFRGISNSTITWSLVNAPSWMHVFPNNGTIYGLTDVTSQGNNTYELIASNAVGTTTYHGYIWVADTYYGSETVDTSIILMVIFLSFITIVNIWGWRTRIGLIQVVAFVLLLVGMFADMNIWDTLWILPTAFVLINAVIFISGMFRK